MPPIKILIATITTMVFGVGATSLAADRPRPEIGESITRLRTAYGADLAPLDGSADRLQSLATVVSGASDPAIEDELRALIYLAIEREPVESPRQFAVSLLSRPHMADEHTLPTLTDLIFPNEGSASITHAAVREEALRVVGALATTHPHLISIEEALSLLEKAAEQPTFSSRGAPEGIFLIGPHLAVVVDSLRQIVGSPDTHYCEEARIRAIELMWQMGDRCPIDSLEAALKLTQLPRVQLRAAEALLARSRSHAALTALQELRRHRDVNKRLRDTIDSLIAGTNRPFAPQAMGNSQPLSCTSVFAQLAKGSLTQ